MKHVDGVVAVILVISYPSYLKIIGAVCGFSGFFYFFITSRDFKDLKNYLLDIALHGFGVNYVGVLRTKLKLAKGCFVMCQCKTYHKITDEKLLIFFSEKIH